MDYKTYHTKTGKPIRLWQGDCMELMSGKGENHWDLAIVDPPYGIDLTNQSQGKGGGIAKNIDYHKTDWDKEAPSKLFFNELLRTSNNQIIFGANHYISRIAKDTPCWIVWDKDNGNSDFADCELAWTSFNTAVRRFRSKWAGMLQHNMKNKQKRIHPTEKPIRLYRWLLQNYASGGDTILDTHGGSMSLAIACYIEDFELDIIELDKDYYNAAVKRFEQHISQKTLFSLTKY